MSTLYPNLQETNTEVITEDELNYKINEGRQEERQKFMKDKQRQLLIKLKHYEKLKHRWTVVKNVSEATGIGLTVVCGILTVVTSAGILGIPMLAIISTTSGTLTSLITTITNKSFINKRRSSLKNKYLKTKETSDKLHLFFEKCSQDEIITIEEMEKFESILNILETQELSSVGRQSHTHNKSVLKSQSTDFLEELTKLLRKQQAKRSQQSYN